MKIEELGEKNRAIPGWIRFLVAAPLIGIASYWVFDYRGIYRWLAELQLSLFDEYHVFLSAILTYLICLVPVFPIFRLLRRRYNQPLEPKPIGRFKLLEQHFPTLYKYVLVTGIVAVMAFISGAYLFVTASMNANLSEIDMSEIRNSEVSNYHVRFEAVLIDRDAEGMIEKNGGATISRVYVPAYQNPLESRLVDHYCIVEFNEKVYNELRDKSGKVELFGVLSKNALPGLVRTEMQDELADEYWVLNYGHNPKTDQTAGYILVIIAIICGILFYFLRISALRKVDVYIESSFDHKKPTANTKEL